MSRFLWTCKADKEGEFKKKLRKFVKAKLGHQQMPQFWRKWLELKAKHESPRSVLVHIVCNEGEVNLKHFGADLYLTSDDLNCCYFDKFLAKCLILDNIVLSFDASNLSKRGGARLISLVYDLKRLFDSRVLVCIFDGSTISSKLEEIIDYKIISNDMLQTPVKDGLDVKSSSVTRNVKHTAVAGIQTQTFYGIGQKVYDTSPNSNEQIANAKEVEAELNLKISDLEASVNKWNGDYGILSGLFADLNAEYDKLVKENEQMKSHLNSKECEWNTHHSNNLKIIDEYKNSVIELTNELNVEKNRSQELEERLNQADAEVHNGLMSSLKSKNGPVNSTLDEYSPINLREKIENVQLNNGNASPAEILQKSLKYLRYDADFHDDGLGVSDRFSCKLRVRNAELIRFSGKMWEGRGKSKYLAKQSAFSQLISAIKCD